MIKYENICQWICNINLSYAQGHHESCTYMYKIRIRGNNYKISTCQNMGRIVDLWKHLHTPLKLFFFFNVFNLLYLSTIKKIRNFSGECSS